MLTVYTYSSCDTCRKAVKWLRTQEIEFTEKPIRETPPSKKELKAAISALGGERKGLLNTSGKDYREQKLATVIPTLSDDEVIARLSENGNLIKRPFLSGHGIVLTGFDEAVWKTRLKNK